MTLAGIRLEIIQKGPRRASGEHADQLPAPLAYGIIVAGAPEQVIMQRRRLSLQQGAKTHAVGSRAIVAAPAGRIQDCGGRVQRADRLRHAGASAGMVRPADHERDAYPTLAKITLKTCKPAIRARPLDILGAAVVAEEDDDGVPVEPSRA